MIFSFIENCSGCDIDTWFSSVSVAVSIFRAEINPSLLQSDRFSLLTRRLELLQNVSEQIFPIL
jgi:hypothetical protein